MKLKSKLVLISILFTTSLFSKEVIVAKVDIHYKTEITPSLLTILNVDNIDKNCKIVKIEDLKNNKYVASKFIKENKILCFDDLNKKDDNKIIFKFGSIEIETEGKILYENDEFIRIKRNDGKIEKIYKDGRER